MYRKAFDQQLSSVSPSTKEEKLKISPVTPKTRVIEVPDLKILSQRGCSAIQSDSHKLETPGKEYSIQSNGHDLETQGKEHNGSGLEKLLDSGVYRCHSSLSRYSAFATRTSPPAEALDKSLRACHSQPLSMLEVNHLLHLLVLES